MKIVPLIKLSDAEWGWAHEIMYDPETNQVMGTNPKVIESAPGLVTFYQRALDGYHKGILNGWLFYNAFGKPIGYVVLDRSQGEWELGIAIKQDVERNRGYGPRAALHAMKWAFEERDAEFITAFSNGTDLRVPKMLKKMGWRKLYHFWLLDRATWDERWKERVE